VVPETRSGAGFATVFCELDQSTFVLFCHFCHTVEKPVRVTISLGERSAVGRQLYEFSYAPLPYFEEPIRLVDQGSYSVYSQLQDFLFGRWYLTIHAEDPSFDIRGQLEQTDNVYALMTSEGTSPPAVGPGHRGITLGTYTHTNPTRTGSYAICHDVVSRDVNNW
jgi:hypothetical protein